MKSKLIAIAMLLITAGFNSEAQKKDFSGDWKLNVQKSEFGDIPVNAAMKAYSITQNENELLLTWLVEYPEGKEVTSTQKTNLNGEPSSVLMPNGKTRVMTANFTEDGKNVQVSKKISVVNKPEELEYELKEFWSLSADSKELLLELTSPAYVLKLVYNREK